MSSNHIASSANKALSVVAQSVGGVEASGSAELPLRILAALKTRRARIGGPATAQLLGLDENELRSFEDVLKLVAENPPTDNLSRKSRVASLRLLTWMETLAARVDDLGWTPPTIDAPSEEAARRQVRAVELILRAMVEEAYGEDDAVEARLKELFKPDVVDKWKKTADKGRILTGTMFSDLASFFSNKQEFGRYERLLSLEGYLALLEDRRKTVQSYLDDIRRIRNVVAHNKQLTPVTILLLDAYFEELSQPLDKARSQGATRVSPEAFLGGTSEEVARFLGGIRVDLVAVQDDLSRLSARQLKTESVLSTLGFGLSLVAAGVAFLSVLFVFLWPRDWALVNTPSMVGFEERIDWYRGRWQRGMMVSALTVLSGVAHAVGGYLGHPRGRGLLATFIPSLCDRQSLARLLVGTNVRVLHGVAVLFLSAVYYDSGMVPGVVFVAVFLCLV